MLTTNYITRVTFEPECTEINVNDVFAIADKYENIYIDYHNVKTDIIFSRKLLGRITN